MDTLARWHRQSGDDTWMLTGTDEHGQKMLRAAAANGATPQEWVDRLVADAWFPLLKALDVANDDFIRTTQPRHEERVKQFVQAIYDRGYIYAGEFEALYCVGCEEFKTESEIVDGTGAFEGLKVCAIHSKPLELLQEKNYFFKLSEFQDRLLELYKTVPDFVRPESARNEVVSFVRSGLKDLSISRSTFDWGIQVPWDPAHVIYVWVDALLNYATAVGYGSDPEQFARRWPAYHVVGKDILRFHAVIWPAMLMAAGVEVPRGVFAHGWLLVGGEKMSKSKLTGIAPTEITEVFGSDAYRFYFLSAIAFGQDGSFSWEDLSARYQAELANGFGNLASRTVAMIERYFEGIVPAPAHTRTRICASSRLSRPRRRTRMPRSSVSGSMRRSPRSGRSSTSSMATSRRTSRGRSRRTTRSVNAWAPCSTRLPRGCGRSPSCSRPSCRSRPSGCGSRSARRRRSGACNDQPLREAGAWGALRPGSSVNGLAPLFPRVEQPA